MAEVTVVLAKTPTDRVRDVLQQAAAEAESLGHQYMGTEHILLALLHDERGISGAALRDVWHVSYGGFRSWLVKQYGPAPGHQEPD